MTAWLGKREGSLFATRTLAGHLLRGALAFGMLWVAVAQQAAHPAASLLTGLAALVLLRGCPVCWTVGLIETLRGHLQQRRAGAAYGPYVPHVPHAAPTQRDGTR